MLLTGAFLTTVYCNAALANPQRQQAMAVAAAFSVSNATAEANGGAGGAGGYVYNEDDKQKPAAASAGTPATTNTTTACRYLDAFSIQLVFAGGTKTTSVRDLVCTLGLELNVAQKIALCIESADYRRVRTAMGEPCK